MMNTSKKGNEWWWWPLWPPEWQRQPPPSLWHCHCKCCNIFKNIDLTFHRLPIFFVISCSFLDSTPSPIIAHYDANFWLSLSPSRICLPLSQSVSFKIAHFAGNWFETMFLSPLLQHRPLLSVDCRHRRRSIHCSLFSLSSLSTYWIRLRYCSRIDLIVPARVVVVTEAIERSIELLLPLHFFFSFPCLSVSDWFVICGIVVVVVLVLPAVLFAAGSRRHHTMPVSVWCGHSWTVQSTVNSFLILPAVDTLAAAKQ